MGPMPTGIFLTSTSRSYAIRAAVAWPCAFTTLPMWISARKVLTAFSSTSAVKWLANGIYLCSVGDRDYTVEIGYVCNDGRWLILSRADSVRIPPVYPSDWVEDKFITVDWNEELRGRTFANLVTPGQKAGMAGMAGAAGAAGKKGEANALYGDMVALARSAEAQRVAGSLFSSMHQVPEQAVSSFVFPSGAGLWAFANGFRCQHVRGWPLCFCAPCQASQVLAHCRRRTHRLRCHRARRHGYYRR